MLNSLSSAGRLVLKKKLTNIKCSNHVSIKTTYNHFAMKNQNITFLMAATEERRLGWRTLKSGRTRTGSVFVPLFQLTYR